MWLMFAVMLETEFELFFGPLSRAPGLGRLRHQRQLAAISSSA
jgi:hypothetical protein